MSDKKMIVVLYDWAGDLAFSSVVRGIESHSGAYFASLSSHGMCKIGEKKEFYSTIDLQNKNSANDIEVYGSLKKKRDVDTWESYLLYKNSNISSTMIMAAPLNSFKRESIFELMKSFSDISNIGYGYAKESSGGPGVIFEALGVTFGFPGSPGEKIKAEEDSRWFEERLLMNGRKKMRHLNGMFRSIYEINFVNDLHLAIDVNGRSLKSLVFSGHGFGELISLNNKSYIWVIPEGRVAYVRECVGLAGGLI